MRKLGTPNNHDYRYQTIQYDKDVAQNIYDEDEFTFQTIESHVTEEFSKTILNTNKSPDMPFDVSLNPYRGCEHGCVYCFARPTHSYLELSPGKDFETKLFAKVNAVDLLKKKLESKRYIVKPIAIGMNTDCYQPIERKYQLTRKILQTCLEYRQPVLLITKSSLILRDIDILAQLAKLDLVQISISVTTLDAKLKGLLEPQTSSPKKRLQTIGQLSKAGVPVNVLVAPVIPKINDHEIESILEASASAGARSAYYVYIRLPYELTGIFEEWLLRHYPDKVSAVLSLISQSRGGQLYNSEWSQRMTGKGVFADLIAKRFALSRKINKLDSKMINLNVSLFSVPKVQQELF